LCSFLAVWSVELSCTVDMNGDFNYITFVG